MTASHPDGSPTAGSLVFFYDVDNTLLDNDRLKAEVDAQLDQLLGIAWSDTFWRLYEAVRQERDVVDIPETLRRFAELCPDATICSQAHAVFAEVDFAAYLYPGALEALAHTAQFGTNVILSDGDLVFQRAKIEQSGIAEAADCHVRIYTHKEQHLSELLADFPAAQYLMVDDKPRIGKAMKPLLGNRLHIVFVCQGKYAYDAAGRTDFQPDLTLAGIADIAAYSAAEFRSGQFHRQGQCNPPASG
ncbi:MAG: HAD family hydrolase [Chloroflexota bacterium]|nr:HAD family hydrolase [Chloroflexota bacterium]